MNKQLIQVEISRNYNEDFKYNKTYIDVVKETPKTMKLGRNAMYRDHLKLSEFTDGYVLDCNYSFKIVIIALDDESLQKGIKQALYNITSKIITHQDAIKTLESTYNLLSKEVNNLGKEEHH